MLDTERILFDFDNFNLTQNEIYTVFAICIAIIFGITATSLTVFGRKQVKRLAYSISVCNAFSLSLLGIIYLSKKVPQYKDFFFFGDNGAAPFHGRSNISVMINIWFASSNFFDIAIGLVLYPEYVGLLTGWIHHCTFIWIMWSSATGNGFIFQVRPFSSTFCLSLIEEVPTFLIAFGSIFPQFRTDLGFGITFFLFRIVYHLYTFIYAYKSGVDFPVLVLFMLTLMLHLFWFSSWFVKYSGLGGRKKSDKAPKKE